MMSGSLSFVCRPSTFDRLRDTEGRESQRSSLQLCKESSVRRLNQSKPSIMRRSARLANKQDDEDPIQPTNNGKRARENSLSAPESSTSPEKQLKKPPKKRLKTKEKALLMSPKLEEKKEKKIETSVKVKEEQSKAAKDNEAERSGKSSNVAKTKKSKVLNTTNTGPRGKLVGAHVSIAGGLHNAVVNAVQIGAKAFGMFLRSQRQWNSKPLEDKVAELFKEACQAEGFGPGSILPHGIYLMNCGSPDDETLAKSRAVLVEELQRCEKLGLTLYNFHPGSSCGKITVKECLDRIGESINLAHAETKFVITVIENMSCQGHTIGGKFEDLRGIIDRVKDKSRVGVCLDTCHTFAAGHDISTEEGYSHVMSEFDRVIGLQYLKALHLNDSKGQLGCHLDRHENIGKGVLGKATFNRIMRDPRFDGIPMILETPCVSDNTYEREINLLYSMM